jgi:hypothetical protein
MPRTPPPLTTPESAANHPRNVRASSESSDISAAALAALDSYLPELSPQAGEEDLTDTDGGVLMSQRSLAEHIGVRVSQIRRHEASDSTPTLNVLRKRAIAPSVSTYTPVFDSQERGPDEELSPPIRGYQLPNSNTLRKHDESRQASNPAAQLPANLATIGP